MSLRLGAADGTVVLVSAQAGIRPVVAPEATPNRSPNNPESSLESLNRKPEGMWGLDLVVGLDRGRKTTASALGGGMVGQPCGEQEGGAGRHGRSGDHGVAGGTGEEAGDRDVSMRHRLSGVV